MANNPRGVDLSDDLDQGVARYCRAHNLMRKVHRFDGNRLVLAEVPNISAGIRAILEEYLRDHTAPGSSGMEVLPL